MNVLDEKLIKIYWGQVLDKDGNHENLIKKAMEFEG